MVTLRLVSLMFAIAISFSAPVWAEDAKSRFERLRQGQSVITIAPIFTQLLMTSLPTGFEPISFEKTKGLFYIRETVLSGETVENWSQMVTVTGMKDLATKPGVTPKTVLNTIADGFKRGCPFSFNIKSLSESPIGGSDAVVAVVSCGEAAVGTGGKTSESALIAVIKGQADFYTLQWAERASPSNTPISIDVKKWTDRFKALGPIKLCPIVPGEKAPYPSCVGDGQKKPT